MNKLFRTVIMLGLFLNTGFSLQAKVFFVDVVSGNDTLDGSAPFFVSGYEGPKKTLSACLSVASNQDTIHIAKGYYPESIVLDRSFLWVASDTVTLKSLTMDGATRIELYLQGLMLYIKDSLQLNQGIITPEIGVLFATKEYAYCSKGNVNSFVNGFYYLENSNPFAGNMEFPIGRDNDFRPVRMNIKQSTYDLNLYGFQLISGAAPAGTLPAGIRAVSKVHHWEMQHIGAAIPQDIEVAMAYDSTTTDDEVYDVDSLRLLTLPHGSAVYADLGGLGTAPRLGEISASSFTDTTGFFALANTSGGLNSLGNPEPFARFTYGAACVGNATSFADASVDRKNTITRWLWNFGTGNLVDTSNAQNPAFTYSTPGVYRVSLKVWNGSGYSDSIQADVAVNNLPQVSFNTPLACPGLPVTLNDQSIIPGGSVASRSWDFGDGTFGSAQVENHTFPAPGTYTVKLVVRSNFGCADSASKSVTMLQSANPRLNLANACLGNNVLLQGTAGYPADTVVGWSYSLNGKPAGNTAIVNLLDTLKSGNYKVTLTVNTNNGCAASVTDSFVVFPKAGVSATISSVCVNNAAAFSSNGGTPGDSISTWIWRISGAVAGTQQNFSRVMFNAGNFPVVLSVVTQNGCTDSIATVATVFGRPQVEFDLDPLANGNDSIQCFKGNRFELRNLSSAGGGQSIISTRWYWDNSVIPATNIQSFGSPGVKRVKLVAGTNKGCVDSAIKAYVVLEPLAVRWGAAEVCHPEPVILRDSSLLSGTTAAERHWIFGDGSVQTTTASSVVHAYPNAGTFLTTLVLKTAEGCSDSFTKPLFLRSRPTLSIIPTGNLPFCPDDSLMLTASGGDSVRWFDGQSSRSRYFRSAGIYRVTAYNGAVCTSTDSFRVWVFNAPVANAGLDTAMILGSELVLNGSGGSSYRWEPSALCSTPNNPSTKVNPERDTLFLLRVVDGNGCIDTDSVRVRVQNPGNAGAPELPNMITPNADGMNDAWDLSVLKDFGDWHLRVFSSNGAMVFEKETGYNNDWKGTDQEGEPLSSGTYLYVMQHRFSGKTIKGYLFIQR